METPRLPHLKVDRLETDGHKIYVVPFFARICRCNIATSVDMIRSVMLKANAAEHSWDDAKVVDVPCHELSLSPRDTLLLMNELINAHAVFSTYFELYGADIKKAMKYKKA